MHTTPDACHAGVQPRPPVAAAAVSQAGTQFSVPQPATAQGLAQLNQQGLIVPQSADAQLSQHGWSVPHLSEVAAQGLVRPILQTLAMPQATEAQVLGIYFF